MERIDRTERLLNLVIALMATKQPLSRSAIRERIPGYDGNDVAFERKFERDKDELRSMGIPVNTVVDAGGEVQGYRISPSDYALPELELTVAERTAVSMAAQAWNEAIAGPVAGRAMLKLNGAIPAGDRQLPLPVHVTAREAALLPLMTAVRGGHDVTFDYQRPVDTDPTMRHVSPWGLRAAQGAWYMVGFDHDRREPRTFRLSRIRGPVAVETSPRLVEPPEGFNLSRYDEPHEATTAHIRLQQDSGASLLRMAGTAPADGTVSISYNDPDRLISEVCAAGPTATVLSPETLVQRVSHALDLIIAQHEQGL